MRCMPGNITPTFSAQHGRTPGTGTVIYPENWEIRALSSLPTYATKSKFDPGDL